jgi:ribosome-binding protein aMBF1 (putative translation factor)
MLCEWCLLPIKGKPTAVLWSGAPLCEKCAKDVVQ